MTDITIKERVYLSKAEDIYVDHHKLMQHQIDGLRFLYAQFKKKKTGVILNDPSGYGKTVVLVLFLQALRKVLSKPALVLCRHAELQHWLLHFRTWADTDDVVFESSNPFLKKSIFVNTSQQLSSVVRRGWSVAVVDDEVPRELQADFKIYVTPHDMKKNLFTFSHIYKWLNPKEEFDVNFFSANATDPVDVEKKSVLVDFFFEEIVFRSKNFTPFNKSETQTSLTMELPRISRKNKDATGKKIKRSKPRIETEANNEAKVARTDPPERNSTITSKDYYKDAETDVESFIRNEKPITGEGLEEFMDFQTMIKSDANEFKDIASNENSVNGDTAVTVKDDGASDVCTADYQTAINDIVNNENDKSMNDSGDKDVKSSDGDTGKDIGKDDAGENDTGNSQNEGITEISVSNNKNVESVLEENKDETIQDVVKKESKKDLDTKLIELEEKTLNKFKGSLLDSIF